ncbi:hypothetical protein L6452_32324 [Arctium lappa]|uniref:Uncharacterized protein n=1 Tax=Arctium lappa TaxID=4217 RepID=A0ACB8Z406_ARCLA|nr:hypothetical protein L6452_32324 [Arctium lappa]
MRTRGSVRTATDSTENVNAADAANPSVAATREGRGRGRGRPPSAQVSVTSGRGRGRPQGTGQEAPVITDDVLAERITQILQATLPNMIAALVGVRNEKQQVSPRQGKTRDNLGNSGKKDMFYLRWCIWVLFEQTIEVIISHVGQLVLGRASRLRPKPLSTVFVTS